MTRISSSIWKNGKRGFNDLLKKNIKITIKTITNQTNKMELRSGKTTNVPTPTIRKPKREEILLNMKERTIKIKEKYPTFQTNNPAVIYVVYNIFYIESNIFTTDFNQVQELMRIMPLETNTRENSWKWREIRENEIFAANMVEEEFCEEGWF